MKNYEAFLCETYFVILYIPVAYIKYYSQHFFSKIRDTCSSLAQWSTITQVPSVYFVAMCRSLIHIYDFIRVTVNCDAFVYNIAI
jgi:hypothetical protein